jgi:hypothetical protein
VTEVTDLVQRYVDTWNETGPDRRRGLLTSVWAVDAFAASSVPRQGALGVIARIREE